MSTTLAFGHYNPLKTSPQFVTYIYPYIINNVTRDKNFFILLMGDETLVLFKNISGYLVVKTVTWVSKYKSHATLCVMKI